MPAETHTKDVLARPAVKKHHGVAGVLVDLMHLLFDVIDAPHRGHGVRDVVCPQHRLHGPNARVMSGVFCAPTTLVAQTRRAQKGGSPPDEQRSSSKARAGERARTLRRGDAAGAGVRP